MKKIIKNKVYDTATAHKLAAWYSSCPTSDFGYYDETLYLKKTGEYFLYGSGNAMSPYSQRCGQNEWCGGESIQPLTYEEARTWAEEHLDGDEYCAIFGEPEEGDDVKITVRISAASADKLKRECSRRGITQGELIDKWIADGD